MNMDKLQKINALANEFKKHNFAKSNEDAYKQAENVYDPAKKTQPTEELKSTKIDSGIIERRIQLILEMNNKKYEQEFATMRTALNKLNEELQSLKTKMQSNPIKQPVQQELKTKPKEDHPRQGKFTSDDVDIQKMFYFGTKR